jgi:hypothetical protein
MPYAANGRITTDNFEGAIEITEDQYQEALLGMMLGLIVTIDDGFKVEVPVPPEPSPMPEPTPEELRVQAIAQRDQHLALAAIRIAPVQDAIDIGEATDDELTALGAWKQYRIALNRIEQQAGFPHTISWPSSPEQVTVL